MIASSARVFLWPSGLQCQWIAVDWNHFTADGRSIEASEDSSHAFPRLTGDDEDNELDGADGKDWGDLGKKRMLSDCSLHRLSLG